MVANSAIILAAGASERLGTHKALVEVGNQTLIESVFNRLERANLEVTIVTRGSLADSIRALLPEANVIVNPAPELGRTGTIQCGINEIGIGPVLIAPVDRPGFSLGTVNLLCRVETTAAPEYNGRGGHPIALTSQDCEAILKARPDVPLRDLINASRIAVNDPHLHLNIDTSSDVEEMIKVADSL